MFVIVLIGEKEIIVRGESWKYIGEIDESGRACGMGEASEKRERKFGTPNYIGTFMDDMPHGVSKYEAYDGEYYYAGEYKQSK